MKEELAELIVYLKWLQKFDFLKALEKGGRKMNVLSGINYFAVIVAGLVRAGLGALWFNVLFGSMWMQEAGVMPIAPVGMPMAASRIGLVVNSLLASLGVAYVIKISGKIGALNGLVIGIVIAILLVATTLLPTWLIRGKGTQFLIEAGFNCIGIVIMGLIIGTWQK